MIGIEYNYSLLAEAVIKAARLDYIRGYRMYHYGRFQSIRDEGYKILCETELFLRKGWITQIIDYDADLVLSMWRRDAGEQE